MKKVTILIRGIVTLYSLGSIIQQLIQVFRHFSSSFVAFGKKKGQLPQRGGQFVVAYAFIDDKEYIFHTKDLCNHSDDGVREGTLH